MEITDFITTNNNCTASSITSILPFGGSSFSHLNYIFIDELVTANLKIEKNPSICSGKPIIRGTRIGVAQIVELNCLLGWSEEQILNAYPHLTIEQIKAAQSYYFAHSEEIDNYIKLEKEID